MKRFSTHIKMIILFVGSNSVNPQFSWCSADADDWVEVDKVGNEVLKVKSALLLPDHNQQQDAISSDVSASFIDDSNTDGDLSDGDLSGPVHNMQPHLFEVISDSLPTSTPTTPTSTPTQEDIDTLIHQIKDFQIDETTRDLINSIMDEICEKATAPSAHQGSVVELPFDAPLSDSTSTTSGITNTTYRCDHNSTTSPHSTILSREPASASPSSSVVTSRVSYAVPILAASITLLYILTKKT